MCDDIVAEFEKLSLTKSDKSMIEGATIIEINSFYPGYNFKAWKKTDTAFFYINENHPPRIKVKCYNQRV